jgi:hypothetical protein
MGPSFLVITLTPPLSREPGEGVLWPRTDKDLFGAENTEITEKDKLLNQIQKKNACPTIWLVNS